LSKVLSGSSRRHFPGEEEHTCRRRRGVGGRPGPGLAGRGRLTAGDDAGGRPGPRGLSAGLARWRAPQTARDPGRSSRTRPQRSRPAANAWPPSRCHAGSRSWPARSRRTRWSISSPVPARTPSVSLQSHPVTSKALAEDPAAIFLGPFNGQKRSHLGQVASEVRESERRGAPASPGRTIRRGAGRAAGLRPLAAATGHTRRSGATPGKHGTAPLGGTRAPPAALDAVTPC
jgi:hypothetical protein